MTEQVKAAVLLVLQRATLDGFADIEMRTNQCCSLTRFQIFVNRIAEFISADNYPFNDRWNYRHITKFPLERLVDKKLIDWAMKELAQTPVCKICGSIDLEPDPSGHYNHAQQYDGAPLVCKNIHPNE